MSREITSTRKLMSGTEETLLKVRTDGKKIKEEKHVIGVYKEEKACVWNQRDTA